VLSQCDFEGEAAEQETSCIPPPKRTVGSRAEDMGFLWFGEDEAER